MGLTQSMNIATGAMSAMQTALSVVSHNVANVSTEGYHKLRTNFAEVISYTALTNNPISYAKSLAGVQVSEIIRYADEYGQSYYWNENGKASYLDTYSQIGSQIEDLMNELDGTGLAKSLSDFYTAVNNFNDDPSDLVSRQNFLSSAQNLCDTFNSIASNLQNLQETTNGTLASVDPSDLSNEVHEINELLSQIADMNESILKTNSDALSSSSLINKRDELINTLSSKINIEVTKTPNNTVNIYLSGTPLVTGNAQVTKLVAENSQTGAGDIVTTISIKNMEDQDVIEDANSRITSGSLAAMLDLTGTANNALNFSNINNFLNNLASEFANTFNEIQTGDPNGDGTTPMCISVDNNGVKTLVAANPDENLFVPKYGTQITAANISVNNYFNTPTNNGTPGAYKIAAARIDTNALTPDKYKYAVGNNANATMMSNSRSAKNGILGGATFEGYLSSNVSHIGYQLSDIDDKLETEQKIVAGIENRMASAYGVNLDEELSDMLRYQQAYKASARVFNVCNNLLDTLLSLGL